MEWLVDYIYVIWVQNSNCHEKRKGNYLVVDKKSCLIWFLSIETCRFQGKEVFNLPSVCYSARGHIINDLDSWPDGLTSPTSMENGESQLSPKPKLFEINLLLWRVCEIWVIFATSLQGRSINYQIKYWVWTTIFCRSAQQARSPLNHNNHK